MVRFDVAGVDTNLVNDIFDTFDNDLSGSIDYTEFVTGLAQFSDGDPDEVLKFIFSLHTADGDEKGSMDQSGLHKILSDMTLVKTQQYMFVAVSAEFSQTTVTWCPKRDQ